jgi:hypothetical protein
MLRCHKRDTRSRLPDNNTLSCKVMMTASLSKKDSYAPSISQTAYGHERVCQRWAARGKSGMGSSVVCIK